MEKTKTEILMDFVAKNRAAVLLAGVVPAFAVADTMCGGLGIGIALAVVTILSALVLAALKNMKAASLPALLIVAGCFAVAAEMIFHAFWPAAYKAAGASITLMSVCAVMICASSVDLGAKAVSKTIVVALELAVGLVIMGAVRELLGAGTIAGSAVSTYTIAAFAKPCGGFLVAGIIAAVVQGIACGKKDKEDKAE